MGPRAPCCSEQLSAPRNFCNREVSHGCPGGQGSSQAAPRSLCDVERTACPVDTHSQLHWGPGPPLLPQPPCPVPRAGSHRSKGPTCSTRSASADGLPSDRVLIVSASSPGRPLGEFLVVVPGAGAQPIGGGGHGVNGGSRGGGWGMGSRLEAHCPHPQASPVALAKSVLAEVPRQLVEYHSHKECL